MAVSADTTLNDISNSYPSQKFNSAFDTNLFFTSEEDRNELTTFKKMLRVAETDNKKMKALYEQKIEHLNIKLRESKESETSLRQMNNNLMNTIKLLENNQPNLIQKSTKELELANEHHLKEMYELKSRYQETITNLERDNKHLREQHFENESSYKTTLFTYEKELITLKMKIQEVTANKEKMDRICAANDEDRRNFFNKHYEENLQLKNVIEEERDQHLKEFKLQRELFEKSINELKNIYQDEKQSLLQKIEEKNGIINNLKSKLDGKERYDSENKNVFDYSLRNDQMEQAFQIYEDRLNALQEERVSLANEIDGMKNIIFQKDKLLSEAQFLVSKLQEENNQKPKFSFFSEEKTVDLHQNKSFFDTIGNDNIEGAKSINQMNINEKNSPFKSIKKLNLEKAYQTNTLSPIALNFAPTFKESSNQIEIAKNIDFDSVSSPNNFDTNQLSSNTYDKNTFLKSKNLQINSNEKHTYNENTMAGSTPIFMNQEKRSIKFVAPEGGNNKKNHELNNSTENHYNFIRDPKNQISKIDQAILITTEEDEKLQGKTLDSLDTQSDAPESLLNYSKNKVFSNKPTILRNENKQNSQIQEILETSNGKLNVSVLSNLSAAQQYYPHNDYSPLKSKSGKLNHKSAQKSTKRCKKNEDNSDEFDEKIVNLEFKIKEVDLKNEGLKIEKEKVLLELEKLKLQHNANKNIDQSLAQHDMTQNTSKEFIQINDKSNFMTSKDSCYTSSSKDDIKSMINRLVKVKNKVIKEECNFIPSSQQTLTTSRSGRSTSAQKQALNTKNQSVIASMVTKKSDQILGDIFRTADYQVQQNKGGYQPQIVKNSNLKRNDSQESRYRETNPSKKKNCINKYQRIFNSS